MKALITHTFLLTLLLSLLTCKVNHNYTSKPTKSLSNPDSDLLEVNLTVYHVNDSASRAYLEIKNENLLYRRPDTTQAFYAELRVHYRLLSEAGSKKVIDSSSFYIYDRSDDELVKLKSLTNEFKLPAKRNNNYYLEVETFDRNKKTKYYTGINVYKQNNFSAQNFLVTVRDTVVFKNNFLQNEQVVIKFTNPLIRSVTVDCFLREFGPAAPPFSTKPPDALKYKPDSVFKLELSTNQFMLTMPKSGFYHVKTNPLSNEGISLYTYDGSFPGVGNSDDMINATRYIMEKTEFETCKEASEKKAAIDKFWLTIGGSNERARELLRRYYGRVKEANKYYTSYTQGWKSDRGMIYVVFGPPTNQYKSKRDEIWVYGNEANPAALRFVFNKTENPFTDNDFILERSQFFKEAWYSAVEYWRQGNIYLESKR